MAVFRSFVVEAGRKPSICVIPAAKRITVVSFFFFLRFTFASCEQAGRQAGRQL